MCYYVGCDSLALLHDMLDEAHYAHWFLVAADCGDWPIEGILIVFSARDERTVRCVVPFIEVHST